MTESEYGDWIDSLKFDEFIEIVGMAKEEKSFSDLNVLKNRV